MVDSKKRLFVVGDSISIHYGPYLKKMLKGIFDYSRKQGVDEADCDLDAAIGGNGGDSGQVLEYLQELHSGGRLKYDILLFNCGLHDIKTYPETLKRQVGITKYRENLHEILSLLKKAKVKPVWVRSTPVNELVHNSRIKEFKRYGVDLDAYNKAADRVMSESGVLSIDLYTFTRNLDMDLYCDHVHFKEEIRALQAAFIAGHLFNLP